MSLLYIKNMDQFLCLIKTYKPIVDFSTSLMPIVLSVFATYIAIQQYRTNRKKLKLDLFEKRYIIFNAINEFMISIIGTGELDDDIGNEYLKDTRGSEFLFDANINCYVNKIWKNAVDLNEWNKDEHITNHVRERAVVMEWFINEHRCLGERFNKYMKLSH